MINSNLVTCLLCQSYYADPRQIPCSHSFCFDCLSGRFDNESMILICPKCDKIHQYQSRDEFESRCIADGFLASMVRQFKRKQNRLLTLSRPSSSMSLNSSIYPSISNVLHFNDIYLSQAVDSSNRLNSVGSFIAKCQSCNRRSELNVCQHCDNVLCFTCTEEHQNLVNQHIKNIWQHCQIQLQTIEHQSFQYDRDLQKSEQISRQYQRLINERGEKLTQLIDHHKNVYLHLIEKHRRNETPFFTQESLIDEFESIEQRLNTDFDHHDELLADIEQYQTRLDNLTKLIDSYELKFPMLTLPEPLSILDFFGVIDFTHFNVSLSSILPNEDYIPPVSDYFNRIIPIPSPLAVGCVPGKEALWQVEYHSVPNFIQHYANRLFISDKYGRLSIYQFDKFNDLYQKPHLMHTIKLFNDDQNLIRYLVVHAYGIVVLKDNPSKQDSTVYQFDHDGYPIGNGASVPSMSVQELLMDFDTSLLWMYDDQKSGIFYSPLSSGHGTLFQHRFPYMNLKNTKPLPMKITISKDIIALLDTSNQTIDIYDKRNRECLSRYSNYRNSSSHICWTIGLFSNQSLLIQLDDVQSLKTEQTKHIFLQMDIFNPQEIIAKFEEMDIYGRCIGPNDEILLGTRTQDQSFVRCYF